ncbi:hypothetical protein Tco_0788515, partial [Tanacetum coccineum]
TQSKGFAGIKASDNAGQARKETEPVKDYILLPLWTANPPYSQDPKSSHDDGSKPSSDNGKKVDEDPRKDSECKDQEKEDNVNSTNNVNTDKQIKVLVDDGDCFLGMELVSYGTQSTSASDPIGSVADEVVHKEFGVTVCSLEPNSGGGFPGAKKHVGDTIGSQLDSFDDEESLGEDASKQRRIDAIDADEEISLVSVHDMNVFAGEEVAEEVVKVINTTKLIIDAAQVSAAGDIVSAASAATTVSVATTTTATINTVDDITLAQALEEMKITKPKKKGIVIQELGESTTKISSQLPSQQSQDKGKRLDANLSMAERMQATRTRWTLSIKKRASKGKLTLKTLEQCWLGKAKKRVLGIRVGNKSLQKNRRKRWEVTRIYLSFNKDRNLSSYEEEVELLLLPLA